MGAEVGGEGVAWRSAWAWERARLRTRLWLRLRVVGEPAGATEKPSETGRLFHRVGWDWGDSYFISSSGVFFHLMRPCPASDNTVSRSVVRISRAW